MGAGPSARASKGATQAGKPTVHLGSAIRQNLSWGGLALGGAPTRAASGCLPGRWGRGCGRWYAARDIAGLQGSTASLEVVVRCARR
jgi:hypothetical protein